MTSRTARRRGMSTLQAVLLLGAAFLVTWGLMDVWKRSQDPLQTEVAKTLRGERGSITPGRGGGGGGTAAGDTPTTTGRIPARRNKDGSVSIPTVGSKGTPTGETTGKNPTAEPDPEARLLDTFRALYLENKRIPREELLELKAFLENTNAVLDNPLSHLVLSEVNLRLGNHWEGFKELLTAVNPLEIVLGRIRMAKQVAKNGRTVLNAGDAARAGKKAVTAATRRGFDSLDLEGRTTKEIREELEKLAKANPGKVKRTAGKNGGDIWAIDLGDGTHGTIRIDPADLKPGKGGTLLAGNMPHAHKEIVDNKVIAANGNTGYYPPGSAKETLNNAGKPVAVNKGDDKGTKDRKQIDLHMPVRERGSFRWDEATQKWVPKD